MKKKQTILIALLLALVMLFAACGNTTSKDTPEVAQNNDDRMCVAAFSTIADTLDLYAGTSSNLLAYMNLYDSLMRYDEDYNVVPCLAESYEVSEDGMAYTFHLRKGVMFSNGEELKAADVVYSVEKGKASPFATAYYADVDYAEAIDDYTVVYHLKGANAAFISYMAEMLTKIVNKNACEEMGELYGTTAEYCVGTGPYTVSEWVPGEYIVFEGNEDYFRGAPSIKHLKYVPVLDGSTIQVALETGEIDFAYSVPSVALESLRASEDINVFTSAGPTFYFIMFNNSEGFFADNKLLRQAVATGIDREKLLSVMFEGEALIVDTLGTPSFSAYPDNVRWYDYDVEAAKKLVEESGYNGEKITLKVLAYGVYESFGTCVLQDLQAIGLNAEIEMVEYGAFLTDVCTNMDYEISMLNCSASPYDMNFMYIGLYSGNVGMAGNYWAYVNPEMDEILLAARNTTDNDERKAFYAQAEDIFYEDVPCIPCFFSNINFASTSDIDTDRNMFMSFFSFYDFYWAE